MALKFFVYFRYKLLKPFANHVSVLGGGVKWLECLTDDTFFLNERILTEEHLLKMFLFTCQNFSTFHTIDTFVNLFSYLKHIMRLINETKALVYLAH